MKRTLIAIAAALLLPASVWSQPRGMGPGMMGGYGGGGYGMGPGMMGGYGAGAGYGSDARSGSANLSDERRAKIAGIEQESARRQAALQQEINAQEQRLDALYASGNDAAARKAYATLSEKRRQLFEESLDARKRIDALRNSH